MLPERLPALLQALLLTTGLLVAGCVTETTGSVPTPADDDVRLAAQLDLARGYLEQRDLDMARRPLERALALDAGNPEANALQALYYEMQGDVDLAEEYFQRALRAGASSRTRNNYGAFLYRHGRLDAAYRQLRIAADDADYSGRALALENLGLVTLRLGRNDEARDALERAVGLNPRLPRPHLELAVLNYTSGDYAAAAQLYGRYRSLAQPTARSLGLGIRLARVFEDADAEASHAITLKNLYPSSAEYRAYREGNL